MTPQDHASQDSRPYEVSFSHRFDFAPTLFYTALAAFQVRNLTPLQLQE